MKKYLVMRNVFLTVIATSLLLLVSMAPFWLRRRNPQEIKARGNLTNPADNASSHVYSGLTVTFSFCRPSVAAAIIPSSFWVAVALPIVIPLP
ncbi:MAG TPA: hypothetical protein VFG29_08000 [Syntrophales bacterium]|nr:hypothetical protein [Syntrophales bacterium]